MPFPVALKLESKFYTNTSGPEVIKLFFMLNSTEHEISTAYKNLNTDK